jgi:aryl-alcohol dehydrogenase-like predicted oxidoreductase
MNAQSQAKWDNAEKSLPESLRLTLRKLRSDYLEAQRVHVPDYRGGPNPGILAELVRQGWRKSATSNGEA